MDLGLKGRVAIVAAASKGLGRAVAERDCAFARRALARGEPQESVIKAYKKKDVELANTVYSGVPSHIFGLQQIIDIGPMSGKSNVLFWLEHRGLPANDDVVERIYKCAKASDHTLSEAEILECVQPAP